MSAEIAAQTRHAAASMSHPTVTAALADAYKQGGVDQARAVSDVMNMTQIATKYVLWLCTLWRSL